MAPERKRRASPETARSRRIHVRPRPSLTDKLANLHLLLRVPSFARWSLRVHFFCQDVYDLWVRWSERVDTETKTGIDVVLDLKKPSEPSWEEEAPPSTQLEEKSKLQSIGQGGVEGIDVGYSTLTDHLDKGLFLLADGEKNSCAVCDENIGNDTALVLVCPEKECRAASHLNCLAQRFLHEEGERSTILPTSGRCPHCDSTLKWIKLVKELSLRLSGEAQIAKLLKKSKPRRKVIRGGENLLSASNGKSKDDLKKQDHDQRSTDTDDDGSSTGSTLEERLQDDWRHQEEDENAMSETSNASGFSSCFDAPSPSKRQGSIPSLGIVVEDSEWEDAEVLD